MLEDVHERLSGVVIENLDWLEFVDRYDRAETLFYLDPPYWGSEHDYGSALFGRDQFELMVERLTRLKGCFILSINDVSQTRALFGRFECEPVSLHYGIGSGQRPAREMIVRSGGSC